AVGVVSGDEVVPTLVRGAAGSLIELPGLDVIDYLGTGKRHCQGIFILRRGIGRRIARPDDVDEPGKGIVAEGRAVGVEVDRAGRDAEALVKGRVKYERGFATADVDRLRRRIGV